MPERTGETVLEADDIIMRFRALQVLTDVNFTVCSDEAVGIVGPNGAGKTTFINVLTGALTPVQGSVTFMGRNITGLSTADRCTRGLVKTHQVPHPFNGMTVFENVFVAAANNQRHKRGLAYQNALDALHQTGMMSKANRRAEALGLLDRKRLELSRALATDPRIILLDEIGGGLSEGESDELVDIIDELRHRHIAIVWIEHIVPLLQRVVERLICMHEGQIIADGKPDEVMADPTVIEAYLGGTPG